MRRATSGYLAIIMLLLLAGNPCLAADAAENSPQPSADTRQEANAGFFETRYYSVTLPDNWKVLTPPSENQGLTVGVFARKNGNTIISMMAGPNSGESAKSIADLFAEQFKASRAPVEKNGRYTFNFSSQNMQRLAWISCDGDMFMLVTIYGNRNEAMNFLRKNVTSKDYPGLLPQ